MKELTMALDGQSGTPLYQQIYQFIKEEITKRQMFPGERLPSTRMLAKQLQVSRSTVDLAYEQLASEGYIEPLPYRGYYVCQLEGVYQLQEVSQTRGRTQEVAKTYYDIDFALDGIDEAGFPYSQWRKISREVLAEEEDLFRVGNSQGDASLREILTSYLHHARGVNCSPDQIVVGAGNDYLLMLLRIILGSNRVIAMENPTYKNAYQGFVNLGYSVASVPMDLHGMKVDALEQSGAEVAYVMPSHQFPMGYVMPIRRRLQLLAWAAKKKGRYLIEDDYDSEFRYRGRPIPALQGYDRDDTVIYLGTFSKSLAPSIRISYMVLPWSLMEVYDRKGRSFSATVSRVDQRIIERFIREGAYERHLNRMRTLYKAKHDLLLGLLHQRSDLYTVSGENAGLHVVLHLASGLTQQDAVEAAKEAGIRVYGISDYDTSEDGRSLALNQVLLGYAALTESQIREGTFRLGKVWEERCRHR